MDTIIERSIDEWLEAEIERCRETKNVFSIIFFDIDHFKQYNDTYDHDTGDQESQALFYLFTGISLLFYF